MPGGRRDRKLEIPSGRADKHASSFETSSIRAPRTRIAHDASASANSQRSLPTAEKTQPREHLLRQRRPAKLQPRIPVASATDLSKMGKGGQQPPKLEDLKLSRSGQPLITAERRSSPRFHRRRNCLRRSRYATRFRPSASSTLCLSVCACDQGHGRRGHVCLSCLATQDSNMTIVDIIGQAYAFPGGGAASWWVLARVRPQRLFRLAVRERLRRTRTHSSY